MCHSGTQRNHFEYLVLSKLNICMFLTPVWVEWGVKLALDLFFGTIIVSDIILNLLLEDAY